MLSSVVDGDDPGPRSDLVTTATLDAARAFSFHSPRPVAGTLRAPVAGGHAELRPLRSGEVEPLESVFAASSPASRQARYLAPMTRLPGAMRTALTTVDDVHHVAWLATVEGRAAGIARYVRTAPDTAELAFEVVDAHQGRGLGTVLLDVITTSAAAAGIERVRATVAASNERSRRLLASIGLALRPTGGLLEGEARLQLPSPARIDRPRALALLAQRAASR